jgi:hypothetical protein
MAKEIGGMQEPGLKGGTIGQIDTPMSAENIGRKNTPTILTYKGTMNTGEKNSGSAKIDSPGNKNKY